MTHKELWDGIMNLANKMNVTCSGLARMAGLDSTTFNKSKRTNHNGTLRWPSTYSLARVLDAAGIGLAEFAHLMPHDTPNKWPKNK
jgi:phage repressor protein C with HTH and peptisase S24 domain